MKWKARDCPDWNKVKDKCVAFAENALAGVAFESEPEDIYKAAMEAVYGEKWEEVIDIYLKKAKLKRGKDYNE